LELFDQTSVFIFPSLWPETLGIVGIEALSRGVPVVASDVGGVREWCHNGETGYVVPPKDATAIASRVQRLLSDEQQLRAFGERGIELIRKKFHPQHHVDRLVSHYERALTADQTSVDAYV
jgi:glycosyltransferase involved in cell wall biosynthesis